MIYVKVNNPFPAELIGNADYKGLDLSQVIPGTQIYPADGNGQVAVCYMIFGDHDIAQHADIEVIDQTTYEQAKQDYINSLPPSPEQQIKTLQATVDQLVLDALMGGA